MEDRIYTALDYAQRAGVETVKDRIKLLQKQHVRKKIRVKVTHLDKPRGKPVKARIWQGIWIADCECGGAEFVSPDEPIFFCWGCGNQNNSGACRPVEFPENREKIEAKILERPVQKRYGLDELSRAEGAQAAITVDGYRLARCWMPDETMQDLKDQQDKAIEAYKKRYKKVK